jgi:NAD dependent epimerase/dehydratase family enzyme
VRLYITAIESDERRGVFNAVAPRPVSNKELTLQLAQTKKGKFFIPLYVPSFVLKTVLGEMSIEVLKSTTVSCDKIHYTGFTFLFPSIDAALDDLEKKKASG